MDASERRRLRIARGKLLGRTAMGAAGLRAQVERQQHRQPDEPAAGGGRAELPRPTAQIYVLHPRRV